MTFDECINGAINYLSENFSLEIKRQIYDLYSNDPDGWYIPYHFDWGMNVRNMLRGEGFKDEYLPTGNWDDYYVEVVEKAVLSIKSIEEVTNDIKASN